MGTDLRLLKIHFLAAMGLSCQPREPNMVDVVPREDAGAPVKLEAKSGPPPAQCAENESPIRMRRAGPCQETLAYDHASVERAFIMCALDIRTLQLASEHDGMCEYKACVPLPLGAAPSSRDFSRAGCCVPMPEKGACPYSLSNAGELTRNEEGKCCYTPVFERYYRGRPLRHHGQPALAPPRENDAWRSESLAALGAGTADGWLHDASMEHASVASFAQLSLVLMAHGAPASLVRACHVAALDEIDHAMLSYGVASARAGRPLGPGALSLPPLDTSFDALVRDTFRDGCLGETLAAVEAGELAATTDADGERRILEKIAADEETHAALAWRILAWALRERPDETRAILIAEQRDLTGREGEDEVVEGVLRVVIMPCLDTLLSADC